MNLEHKIGQMLVFGWDGESDEQRCGLSEHVRMLVVELRVGGLILFARNVRSHSQLSKLIQDLQSLAAENGVPPLFICIDQEGGPRTRLIPPQFRASRQMWDIGETGDPDEARTECAAIGRELAGIGINWNLAPVLDVNNNPANPVIGARSFGADPSLVAAMASEAIKGFQDDAGVMACGKHFPGHGDTTVDSHAALPVIEHDMTRLSDVELVPFRAAIKAGIVSIMTSHILFPAIDPDRPATLSKPILAGILRGKLGFDGLIVTDCLQMRGITDRWSPAEAAIMAVEAGADMLLCCHSLEPQRAIVAGLIESVIAGRISEARIDESVRRIQRAKGIWTHAVTRRQMEESRPTPEPITP